jgi:hypothetical protein
MRFNGSMKHDLTYSWDSRLECWGTIAVQQIDTGDEEHRKA